MNFFQRLKYIWTIDESHVRFMQAVNQQINAQQNIARELHVDLSAQIAILQAKIEGTQEGVHAAVDELRKEMTHPSAKLVHVPEEEKQELLRLREEILVGMQQATRRDCLNMAVNGPQGKTEGDVLRQAKAYEDYIKG